MAPAAVAYDGSHLSTFPTEEYAPGQKLRICVTGAGGFIASHLARRLKREGHYIVAADWKRNEHMTVRLGTKPKGSTDTCDPPPPTNDAAWIER